MELCDLSMQGYLYPSPDGYIGTGLPPLLKDLPVSALGDHIWNIMKQIASGLKFIHANSEAHRDLKPSNGTGSVVFLIFSPLFTKGFALEVDGFRACIGDHGKSSSPYNFGKGFRRISSAGIGV